MVTVGIQKILRTPYDEALAEVPEALKAEGFGVLTEIDVKNTLQEKLGVETRRYTILGACNPPFAHRALKLDLRAGLMMPCNVILCEDDQHRTVVLAADPTNSASSLGNPVLSGVAAAVKERLTRALARLA